ncbi:hypothetical protein [Tenacibaculum sp. SG-28]|uniref:hypothetical protein n=1 Tax=Tenacibaculum sp. SG-28 TaxID=754426 RepID=UPI000CF519CF|nr:hypothetical protein [Tenacibaculum sp. SG-28]PQJ21672.1 hypothetical protein BSU00_06175 [Tenacibaculum sp. SG-28]
MPKFKLTTYKTLKGTQEFLELTEKKSTEAIVYQDDEPKYYVNCFDLQTESNIIMNSLVLGQSQKMEDVIKKIAQKNNVNIAIKKVPLFSIEKSFEYKHLDLPPLPENWLS